MTGFIYFFFNHFELIDEVLIGFSQTSRAIISGW